MSKRLPPILWWQVVQGLEKRDGGLCQYPACPYPGKKLVQPLNRKDVPRREWTTINHRNANKNDYRPENIELTHLSCNISHFHDFNRKARLSVILGSSQAPTQPGVSGEGENAPAPLSASLPGFRIVPAREGDAFSNRKNQECQPIYYLQAFRIILEAARTGNYWSYDELNDALAIYVGEVPSTTGRYLNMLKSEFGPFEEVEAKSGKLVLVFRKPYYGMLQPGQLMACWPPGGLRSVDEQDRSSILKMAEKAYDELTMKEVEARFGTLAKKEDGKE